jgi:hypothetical protein
MSYGTFSFCTLQDIVHIFVLLFHMQVWTHDPRFIWSSPKRPKGVVWGSCLGCNTDTCKVCTGFEVTCKLTPNQKAVGPCGCRDPTACFNCREPIVNRIFSEVVTELCGPILPFLEMRKVLEHWREACPALRYGGPMKSEAHAKPITLVLQPTILHSIFFFISLKTQVVAFQKVVYWVTWGGGKFGCFGRMGL